MEKERKKKGVMTYAYIVTSLNMSDNLTIPHEVCITDDLDAAEISRLLVIINAYSARCTESHIYCPNEEIQYMVRHSNGSIHSCYSNNVEVRENLNCIVFSTEEF